MLHEKMLLEERILRLENKKVDEIWMLEKDLEQERKMTKPPISEHEKKIAKSTQKLANADSSLAIKENALSSLHVNLKELDDSREMNADIIRKNEQTAAISKMQATQLGEYQAPYKEALVLRKQYFNIIEGNQTNNLNDKDIISMTKDIISMTRHLLWMILAKGSRRSKGDIVGVGVIAAWER